MTEYDDQRSPKMRDGVLDASDRGRIDHFTRRANYKDFTDPLIEDDLRPDPRIRAAHDHRERLLVMSDLGAALDDLAGGRRVKLAGDKPLIPLDELFERITGRDRRR